MSSRTENTESIEDVNGIIKTGVDTRTPVGHRLGSKRAEFVRKELPGFIVAVVLVILLWQVMGDVVREYQNLPGTDTYWHTTLIDEASDRLKNGQPIGPISESINVGIPYLYDTGSTYPQAAYWVGIAVTVMVGSSQLAFASLMFGAVLVAQLSFFFGFKRRFGVVAATIGALAFGYSPFLLTNVGTQGRLPAVLAASLIPLILAALLNILQQPTKKWWITGFVASVLSVSFHPMVFYMSAVAMAIVLGATVLSTFASFKRIVFTGSMIVLGVFGAWLFLPSALSSLSFSNTAVDVLATSTGAGARASTGAESFIVPFSIRWNSFDVNLADINENYAGLGLAVAGLLTPFVAWRKKVVLPFVSALGVYLLATGTLTPFWNMIPLASVLEPRRFLFTGALLIALAIAAAVSVATNELRHNASAKIKFRASLVILVFIALIAFDAVPLSERLSPEFRGFEKTWIEPAGEASEGGRVFWSAIKDFAPYFFIGRELGVGTIGRLGDVDLSSRQGFPETGVEQLALLDVRAVLTDSAGFQPLVAELKAEGFTQNYERATQLILTSDIPSARVMVPSRKVGLVGAAATLYWSRILPNSVKLFGIGTAPDEYLDSFGVIVVSGLSIEDKSLVESELLKYVEKGGLVVFGEPNRLTDDWFGVEGAERPVPEILTIGVGVDSFQTQPWAIGSERYVGTFYDEAGSVELSALDDDDEVIPIIQKREIGKGAAYWICCNIGNHTVVNPGSDLQLAYAVRAYFEDELGGYSNIWPKQFGSDPEILGPSDFSFEYESDSSELVVISNQLLSQRRVLLDDEVELEMLRYGGVMAIVVPSGSHKVLVTTSSAPIKPVSFVFWILALIATGLLLRNLWSRFSTPTPPSGGVLPAIRRWIFGPPFVHEFEVGSGILKICEPWTGGRFDFKSSDRTYQRLEPSMDNTSLAVVLVELSAPSGENLSFDFGELKLVDRSGVEFSAVSTGSLQSQDLLFPNLIYLVDFKRTLLPDLLDLSAGESIRGYVVFEFATEVEYPFVHDGFVILH